MSAIAFLSTSISLGGDGIAQDSDARDLYLDRIARL
jgi:hypothetical protein